MRSLVAFTLLSVTSVSAIENFQDYIAAYLPDCIVSCTAEAAETDTGCGRGSVTSTSSSDISCLCDALVSTDVQLVGAFSNSITECVTNSGCSASELAAIANIDPYVILGGSDTLCASSGSSNNNNNSNDDGDDDADDDTDDDDDNDDDDDSNTSTNSGSNDSTSSSDNTSADVEDNEDGALTIVPSRRVLLAASALVAFAAF